MNIVDSSGWLEYFAGTSHATPFVKPIENLKELIVPTISLAEVFKKIVKERGEPLALRAVAHMKQGNVVDLDDTIALKAAKLGYELKLPMVESIILATAYHYNATLWTQDSDFEGIAGVRYDKKELCMDNFQSIW